MIKTHLICRHRRAAITNPNLRAASLTGSSAAILAEGLMDIGGVCEHHESLDKDRGHPLEYLIHSGKP